MSIARKIDLDEVRKAAELIHAPELPFEVRVLDCKLLGEYRTGNFFGYYDLAHLDDLLADLERIESAAGVYWTPNPVTLAFAHSTRQNQANAKATQTDPPPNAVRRTHVALSGRPPRHRRRRAFLRPASRQPSPSGHNCDQKTLPNASYERTEGIRDSS